MEVEAFFRDIWSTEVLKIFNPSSGVIVDYLDGLLQKIQHLKIHEVTQHPSRTYVSVCLLKLSFVQKRSILLIIWSCIGSTFLASECAAKRQNPGCGDPYRCASAYCSISNEDELKTHIRSKGEQVNVPLAFLMDTSQDTVVKTPKEWKNQKILDYPPPDYSSGGGSTALSR